MSSRKQPGGMDVKAFAQSGGERQQQEGLADYPRLLEEVAGSAAAAVVRWHVHGEMRHPAGLPAQPWLHVQAEAVLPLACQRCLEPVEQTLQVDRWFRFVADEAQAALEDEDAEEDVLALDPEFDLRQLVEDELLMELPLVPRHAHCPVDVPVEHAGEDFARAQAAKPRPFDVLSGLGRKADGDGG